MKISIIVPAFNEANRLERNLSEIESYMNGYAGNGTWELVVLMMEAKMIL